MTGAPILPTRLVMTVQVIGTSEHSYSFTTTQAIATAAGTGNGPVVVDQTDTQAALNAAAAAISQIMFVGVPPQFTLQQQVNQRNYNG